MIINFFKFISHIYQLDINIHIVKLSIFKQMKEISNVILNYLLFQPFQ